MSPRRSSFRRTFQPSPSLTARKKTVGSISLRSCALMENQALLPSSDQTIQILQNWRRKLPQWTNSNPESVTEFLFPLRSTSMSGWKLARSAARATTEQIPNASSSGPSRNSKFPWPQKLPPFLLAAWGAGGQADAPGIEKVGSKVSAPVPLDRPDATYTESARMKGITGVCLVGLIVDAAGIAAKCPRNCSAWNRAWTKMQSRP